MGMEQALATFLDEARDLLDEMEGLLLTCEKGTADEDSVNALFRAAHTIKGSAGLFGLDDIVRFTHKVESVLDRLRAGELEPDSDLAGLLLACRDHIGSLVEAVAGGVRPEDEAASGERLLALLDHYLAGPATLAAHPPPAATGAAEPAAMAAEPLIIGPDHWHLSLRFDPGVLRSGMDPLAFIRYLGTMGQLLHVEVVSDHMPVDDSFDAQSCYLGFEIAFRGDVTKEQIESVFEFVRDDACIRIIPPHSRIQEYIDLINALPENTARLGEILIASGTLTRRELNDALRAQDVERSTGTGRPLGEMLIDAGVVPEPVVDAALAKQKRSEERRTGEAKTIKVPADRLDQLIDLVGELVIAGAAAQLTAGKSRMAEMVESASHLLGLVEEVRDTALRLRMVQVGEVFGRFPRVVRDVSRELGKDIALRISGAETELDKSMVEKIADPLMHLVRNAIDHGIESPQRRQARGKPAQGTILLNAYHESGSIVIEVSDDGGGLDADKILAKAIERGLVQPSQSLTPQEIHRLIMEPGFSTAERVSNLSGRGVGMDVVRSNVEALRGSLEINSESGQGTCMRICLPLTLAIIDGFLVSIGRASFVVPLDMVVECIELNGDAAETDYLNLRGEVLPLVRLKDMFEVEGLPSRRQNVVVVSFAGRKVGLVVDHLLGECQTVIKPLGRLFGELRGISGSTILGSGEVALILDVPQLVEHAVAHEDRTIRSHA